MFLLLILYLPVSSVIVVDDVWFYGDHKLRVLNTGDIVEIIESKNDFVKVRYDGAVGEIHRGVLVNLHDEVSEDKLLVFAYGYFTDGEYIKSARLFAVFINNFNKSNYFVFAQYYNGVSLEEVAKRINPRDSLKLRADQSLPLQFIIYNKENMQYYYNGELYKLILEKYPKSIYASKSAYRLITIFRAQNLPWHDSVDIIQQELTMWHDYIKKYQDVEEYPQALLEIGYLNRVIFEITNDIKYSSNAVTIFQKVIKEFPNTIHSASAKVNLKEIEKGEKIYKF